VAFMRVSFIYNVRVIKDGKYDIAILSGLPKDQRIGNCDMLVSR